MSFIRTITRKVKPVEKHKGYTIFRWDAEKEIVSVPQKKGDPIQKESGNYICTECIIHGEVTRDILQSEIDKDLSIRYQENPPIINAENLLAQLNN